MSSEVAKIFGDTPTSILRLWYFGININIFVYSSMSGKYTQSAINLMNALVDQQLQAWHESLEMVFYIVIRLNI